MAVIDGITNSLSAEVFGYRESISARLMGLAPATKKTEESSRLDRNWSCFNREFVVILANLVVLLHVPAPQTMPVLPNTP